MLSDEEKRIIKSVKEEYKKGIEQGNVLFPIFLNQAKILLNLIKKQQKEIEKLKENNGYHLGFVDGGIAKRYEIENKIKAKIEEVDYKMIAHQDVREAVKQVLQSLLEKE